jgi:hypothetical protein
MTEGWVGAAGFGADVTAVSIEENPRSRGVFEEELVSALLDAPAFPEPGPMRKSGFWPLTGTSVSATSRWPLPHAACDRGACSES